MENEDNRSSLELSSLKKSMENDINHQSLQLTFSND